MRKKYATIIMLRKGPGPFSFLTGCFAGFSGCTFNVSSYGHFIRSFTKALEIENSWAVDPPDLARNRYWKQHITRWAETVPRGARRLIVARLGVKHGTRTEPMESRVAINVKRDRVLIVGDTLAINVRVHKGRQLWLYEHRPRARRFLWRLERGDVVGSLSIDERHCVFDWPELIWRLRVYGYLARTRNRIKRLRTDAIRNELCCDEEMEISSYVSWLIDGEMASPLYHEEKYQASLLFARNVLTAHVFLHQLVYGSQWRSRA
jgi:hypothetical protein